MQKGKIIEPLEIEADQLEWLKQMAESHSLADASKALRIVLPVEDGALAHPEIALLAAEAPDDLPCSMVDLVERVRVAGRDEEVAVT